MLSGQALLNTLVGGDDFGGDAGEAGTTLHFGGPGRLADCWKCPKCGKSITKEAQNG